MGAHKYIDRGKLIVSLPHYMVDYIRKEAKENRRQINTTVEMMLLDVIPKPGEEPARDTVTVDMFQDPQVR